MAQGKTINPTSVLDPSSISHTELQDIGSNTHAQIDSHIASTANPHSVTAAQVGTYTSAEIDALLGGEELDITDLSVHDVIMWNGSKFVTVPEGTSFTFAIASFTSTGGSSTQEIGTGTWKAAGAISFSASYTNGPATSAYVSHSGWSNLTLASTTGPTVSTEAITYPASPGLSKSFTLNASNGTTSPTSAISFSFVNRRYWGVSTVTSGFTEANVEALASNELSNSRAKSFTVTPGASEYIVYAYPSRLSTATFTVGGFEGGFESPETVSITNASGYSENFYVYRSTNANLGSTTVTVT
jgi:hypothetical protein